MLITMTIFLSSDYHCDDYFQTSKEFCVDVSTYEPVEWVEEEAETCETVFVKVILILILMMIITMRISLM